VRDATRLCVLVIRVTFGVYLGLEKQWHWDWDKARMLYQNEPRALLKNSHTAQRPILNSYRNQNTTLSL
jgi:hypothetical protein